MCYINPKNIGNINHTQKWVDHVCSTFKMILGYMHLTVNV